MWCSAVGCLVTHPEPARGAARHHRAAAGDNPQGRGAGTHLPSASCARVSLPSSRGSATSAMWRGRPSASTIGMARGTPTGSPRWPLSWSNSRRTSSGLHSDAAAWAAKRATTSIPIVVGVAVGMVEQGLVASLAQPGGNLTGLELPAIEVVGEASGAVQGGGAHDRPGGRPGRSGLGGPRRSYPATSSGKRRRWACSSSAWRRALPPPSRRPSPPWSRAVPTRS